MGAPSNSLREQKKDHQELPVSWCSARSFKPLRFRTIAQAHIAALIALLLSLGSAPSARAQQSSPQRFIVRFKERTAAAATAAADQLHPVRSEPAFGIPVISVLPRDGAVVAALSEADARSLAGRSDVESVEVDVPMRAFRTTNDPLLDEQRGLETAPGANVFSAWDTSIGSSRALVAVLDSGIDDTHPDLAKTIWRNPKEVPNNGVDDDRNGYIDDFRGYDFVNNDNLPRDDAGHGSHVAGIIAASGNNRRGVVGVAWGSKVVPLKVLDYAGEGFTSDVIRAIDYVGELRQRGVPIVAMNMSIGGSYSVALERAVRRALMNDLLIVAAAGNEGMNIDTTKVYPASFQLPHIVSVSAVDAQGGLASYSNYGAYSVAVSAPGDDVISTVPRVVRGSYYEALSGTSMATAYVTGTAALVAAVNHRLTAPLIRDVVIASSQKDAALQGLSISEGYLDAQAAIALAPTRPSMFRFTGSVVNRKGRGVRGVAVTLRAARKRTRRATTRANGTFTISRLAAATYTIRVAKRGYRFAPTEKVLALYQDKRRVFRAKRSGS